VRGQGGAPRFHGDPPPSPEPPDAALSDAEAAALRAEGTRLLVADLADFQIDLGDRFSAPLAWLASVVAFLNEVAGSPHVDVDALVATCDRAYAAPAFDRGREAVSASAAQPIAITLKGATTLRWIVDGEALRTGTRSRRPLSDSCVERSSSGSLGLLAIPLWPTVALDGVSGLPAPAFKVTQKRSGAPDVVAEGRGGFVLLPTAFDSTKPYFVEAAVAAGVWTVGGPLRIGMRAAQ
jgi:hypothetical protein